MEARQKAHIFIEECGFKKSKHSEDLLEVYRKDFNASVLARFMKEYVWEILTNATENNGSFWEVREWWEKNNVKL